MTADTGFFNQPHGTMPEIKSLWAYIVVDPKEGRAEHIQNGRDELYK
jgi:hypothetical protein